MRKWKKDITRYLKTIKIPAAVKQFRNTSNDEIVMVRNGKPSTVTTIGKLKAFAKGKKSKINILISANDGWYAHIPLKAYLAMSEVEKIYISLEVLLHPDGADDTFLVAEKQFVVTSMSDLMDAIRTLQGYTNFVNTMQNMGWEYYTSKTKCVLITHKGKTKFYKNSMGDMLRELGLSSYINKL